MDGFINRVNIFIIERIGMKKQISTLIIMLFLIASFCGCLGDNKESDNSSDISSDSFIGTWYGWEHYPSFYITWVFYDNNSLKINDLFKTEWGSYKLKGDKIEINTPFIGFENDYMTDTYKYSFTENKQNLTLTNTLFENDKVILYKEGYRGEFYQKIKDFIGKWSNQTLHINYGSCGDWIEYDNYTFYENFTVRGEYNWCSSGSNTWHSFIYDFTLDSPSFIKIGSMVSEYNFSQGKTIFNYQGKKYYKIE